MNFRESLRHCVESTEGAQAGLLMDLEGIALASYQRDDIACDIEAVGAEASVLVKAIRRTGEMLEAGRMVEISFQSERLVTLIRLVGEGHFLALALGPDGNIGKGRYVLRTTAPEVLPALV